MIPWPIRKWLSGFLDWLLMIRRPIPKWLFLCLAGVSICLLFVAYMRLSAQQHEFNPTDTTIPSLSQIGNGIVKICTPDRGGDRWLVIDAKATLLRVSVGMFLSVMIASILGVAMGCFAWLEAILQPPLAFMAKVPPTAALAVFFVLVGTDTPMFLAMITFGVVPSMAISVYLSVRDVPNDMLNKAYTLGASRFEVILCIIVPYILPRLIDAVRLQIGPALVYLIAAEMLVANVGFGYRIRLQSKLLAMDVVYPYLAILAGFGFLVDSVMKKLQHACCRWYIGERS